MGRDQAAEWRPDDWPDQARPGDRAERLDEPVLGRLAQDNQPSDRRHEGGRATLQRTSADKHRERGRETADQRRGREHGDGCCEHSAGAETRSAPAGRRHEHRHRDEVDGDGEARIERRDAEARANGRQRRHDDGRIQRFHEKCCGHGQRDTRRSGVGRIVLLRRGLHASQCRPSRGRRRGSSASRSAPSQPGQLPTIRASPPKTIAMAAIPRSQ